MINQWLKPNAICVVDRVENWQDALRKSAEPLLQQGAIMPAYLDAIFASHAEIGPYYVLSPGLAMPHARPEQGACANALSLLRIQQGVSFEAGENDPVRVIVMLSAVNGDEHLQMIAALAELFSDESRLQLLLSATSPAAIQAALTLNQQEVSS